MISKHLMLKFIALINGERNSNRFISKYLMLKFIDIAETLTPVFENFKTSYVEVYHFKISYVEVYRYRGNIDTGV